MDQKTVELEPWQQKIVERAHAFGHAMKANFEKSAHESSKLLPLPQSAPFLVNTYIDTIVGMTVWLVAVQTSASLELEEEFVKQVRGKFAVIRAELIKKQLAGAIVRPQ